MKNVVLKTIDSKNIYGTLNGGSVRYTNITDADKKMIQDMKGLETLEEVANFDFRGDGALRSTIFKKHRQTLAEHYGFDWAKMFMADQKCKDGSVFEITRDYVEAYPNGWTDIPEDILMMKKDVTGVALGHPVADCAVVVAEDQKLGMVTVAHCGGEQIDLKIPMMSIEALYRQGSKPEDIVVTVGARAGDSWVYTENRPSWATDTKVWDATGAIVPGEIMKDERMVPSYAIRQDNALAYEFNEVGIPMENIVWDQHDTITDAVHYSNSAAAQGNVSKLGRQFIGAFYQEEGKVKVK